MLVVRTTLPPLPLELGRAVAHRPGAALLWTAAGRGPSFVTCDPIGRSEALDPEPGLPLDPSADPLASTPRWIGLLPYECRRELERLRAPDPRPEPRPSRPLWHRYGAVAVVTDRVDVVGDDAELVRALCRRLEAGPPRAPCEARLVLHEPEPDELHLARIRRALELIAAGEIYQVNLARRLELSAEGGAVDLLGLLARRAPAPFAIACSFDGLEVAGSSPQLFLKLRADGTLRTSPIKGTRPRGADPGADRRLAEELETDPKERAELAMILDVERNDLGRVAQTGSVRLAEPPVVVTHESLHHRGASIEARLKAGLGRDAVLRAVLPSGSVTGAPKIRAMEIIAALEPHRRGLYTGAYGALCHDGGLLLGMAIRTLVAEAGHAHYFVGGGIVADSDPAREVEETRWKAVQLGA